MTGERLITVIVPVYNVEKYLEKCVRSILDQTYTNLEIFLVDDGSTDSSGLICDNFAALDSRIKVIHKKNGGLSDARNVALDQMKGDYVTFVDSDDYVDAKYIEVMYDTLINHDSDISVCEMCYVTSNGRNLNRIQNDLSINIYCGKDAVISLMQMKELNTSAPAKLYKREIFESRRYPKGKLFEDIPVMYDIVLSEYKFVHIRYAGYYYLFNEAGISKNSFTKRRMDGFVHLRDGVNKAIEKYPDTKEYGEIGLFNNVFLILLSINDKKNYHEEWELISREINKYRYKVLFAKECSSTARRRAMMSYLPKSWISPLISCWQKMKR